MRVFYCFMFWSSFLMGQSQTECDFKKFQKIEKTLPNEIIQILEVDTLQIKKEINKLNDEIVFFKGRELRKNNYSYFAIEYDDATFIKIRRLPLFKKIITDFEPNNDTISGFLTIRSISKTYEFVLKDGFIINATMMNRKRTKLKYFVDYNNFYLGTNWPNFKQYFALLPKYWEGVYYICESQIGVSFLRKEKKNI